MPARARCFASTVGVTARAAVVRHEVGRARLAFTDVTQKNNSRTVVACLIPPKTFLTNKAPYLAFMDSDDHDRAACLGVMNSLPFDWQARRFVEINLNFFILEGLIVPDLDDASYSAIAEAAARLVMVFARHDRAFSGIGIPSVRELFLNAGANARDPEDLDPDVLFPLADAVSVRRDRRFIESNYHDAVFPDGTPVRFPTPHPQTARYDLDAANPRLFDDITTWIGALRMARYRPSAYAIADKGDGC